MLQVQKYEGLEEEVEEEEDDEPIFVLTDEWREFFAKSEAKRKLGSSFSPAFFVFLEIIWYFICTYVLQRRSRLKRRRKNK